MRVSAMAALLLFTASAAPAADPAVADRSHGVYFNRPGATMADEQADFDRCAALAAKTVPSPQYAGGGMWGALVSGVAGGIRKMQEQERNLDTCMVVAGWRAIYLTTAEADRLKAAAPDDMKAQLAQFVGSEAIGMGVLGRTWANDIAEPRLVPAGAAK